MKITFARCRSTNVSVVARSFLLPFVPIHDRDARMLMTAGRPPGPAIEPGTPVTPPAAVPNGGEDEAPALGEDDPAPPANPAPVPAPVPPAADDTPTRGEVMLPAEDVAPETETCGVVVLGTDTLGVVAAGVVTRGVVTDGVVTDGTVRGGGEGVGGAGGSGGGDGVVTGGGDGVVIGGVVTVVTGGTGTVTLGTVVVGTVGSKSAPACSGRTPNVAKRPIPKSRMRMAAPLMLLQLRCRRFGCAPVAFGNIPRAWLR